MWTVYVCRKNWISQPLEIAIEVPKSIAFYWKFLGKIRKGFWVHFYGRYGPSKLCPQKSAFSKTEND